MQTLRELFNEISTNDERWSYYKNPCYSIIGTWDSIDGASALDFIKHYFNFANKSKVFNDVQLKKKENFIKARSTHIISTFLLGIKIAESFGLDIEICSDDGFNFKYYWFLTCLYHDIGYAYERDFNRERLKMLCTEGIDAIQTICNIKYLDRRVFKSLSYEQADVYLRGRASQQNEHSGVVDHGIVAGLLMYDRLRKQFEVSWHKRINRDETRESFHIRNQNNRILHLSNSHYEAYATAADAIIRHNVFNDTLNAYINAYQLKNLEYLNDKISTNNKLGFILGIADTIEPLKRNLNYIDLIQIESMEHTKGIRIKVSIDVFESVYSNIDALSTWLSVCVNVSKKEDDIIIEISISDSIYD